MTAVKTRVPTVPAGPKDLLARVQVEPTVRDHYDRLAAHPLPFPVGVAVVPSTPLRTGLAGLDTTFRSQPTQVERPELIEVNVVLRDEKRAWVPNYDLFFFEVQTHPSTGLRASSGIKMLHEMRPGEMGSLVVSTPILPRYKIGDTILAFRSPYFRCIGRDRWYTPLRYAWDELQTLNLSRL